MRTLYQNPATYITNPNAQNNALCKHKNKSWINNNSNVIKLNSPAISLIKKDRPSCGWCYSDDEQDVITPYAQCSTQSSTPSQTGHRRQYGDGVQHVQIKIYYPAIFTWFIYIVGCLFKQNWVVNIRLLKMVEIVSN